MFTKKIFIVFFVLYLILCKDSYAKPSGLSLDDISDSKVDDSINADNIVYILENNSPGDGSSWSQALNDFPTTFTRGTLYLFGPGSYGNISVNTSQDSDKKIWFRKADDALHGTNEGWDPAWSSQISKLEKMTIQTSYITFNGTDRSLTHIYGGSQGSVVIISGDYLQLMNSSIDGNFQTDANGYQSYGSCGGLSISGNYIEVAGLDIHNIADDGVEIYNAHNLVFKNNIIRDLYGVGTDYSDGPCYNGHSDGLEINMISNALFIGNYFYNISRNAAIYVLTGESDPSQFDINVQFINNIMYNSWATGFIAYFRQTKNLVLYNNIFWGQNDWGFGGLCIGPNLQDFHMKNNIILSFNYSLLGASYDAQEHTGENNIIAYPFDYVPHSSDIITSDPGFSSIPNADTPTITPSSISDFFLTNNSPGLNAGQNLSDIFTNDFFDQTRTNYWDIGPFNQN